MNFDELWVGDKIYSISIGSNVFYEGMLGTDKVKVRHVKREILLPVADLIEPEIELKKKLNIQFEERKETFLIPANSIDLHYEKLFPNENGHLPVTILDKQLLKFDQYLDNVIQARLHKVEIIHGKGQGVLRAEIEQRLKQNAHVNYVIPTNDGGAKEVWLKYY